MQRKSLVLLSVATIVIAGLLVSIAFANRNTAEPTGCHEVGKAYAVVIKNDKMNPENVEAKRCDTLTITNQDDKTRKIGFGDHDKHVAYDGVSEQLLAKDETLTITLQQTGTFHFHDHFEQEVEGQFTIR